MKRVSVGNTSLSGGSDVQIATNSSQRLLPIFGVATP